MTAKGFIFLLMSQVSKLTGNIPWFWIIPIQFWLAINLKIQSGRGQPHSKTLRIFASPETSRSVLECGCPRPDAGALELELRKWLLVIGNWQLAIGNW